MTKHDHDLETRSAIPLETRDDTTVDLMADATAAVEELRTAAEQRHTAHQTEVRGLTDRIASLETRLNRPNGGTQTETRDERTDEQRAFGTYLRRGDAGVGEVERRALTIANDASAGYLAPPEFGTEIIKALVEHSPIRQYARVMTIAGHEIRYPRRLSGTNAQWAAEIENRPESSLVYDQVTLTPHEIATFVEVSKQLVEDSAFDIETEIRDAFAEDIGVKEGLAFISGDGVGKPKGILNATGIPEIVTGHASTLGAAPADLLIDVFSRLPTAYAQNGAWLLNRKTLAAIRKLKDAQGAYLWQPSLVVGQPATILGRPIIEAVDADDVGAGKYPIVFGDFSGYRIVDRVGVSVLVDPFTRARNGITTFHCRKRVGGDVTDPKKFIKVKVGTAG